MLNMEEYLKYLNQSDKTVLKAIEVFEKEEAFPQMPEQSQEATNNEGTEETVA
jgi:carboxyl-terminal processing protease